MTIVTMISRLARSLQTPGRTVFFGAVLVISAAGLVYDLQRVRPEFWVHSSIGSALGLGKGPGYVYFPRGEYYAVRSAAGVWRIVFDPDSSANAVAQEIAASPSSVTRIANIQTHDAVGLYDPTIRVEERRLELQRCDGTPLPAEDIPGVIHAMALSDASPMVDPKHDLGPWELTAGGASQRRTTILWNAVANNTIAAAGSLGFLWSLGWVPRLLARQVRAARLARGFCPWCAYDRKTATLGPCPECGSPFVVDRENA